ncbi:hypothetical protein Y1Q_0018841 [Alligator mississippiensis]|uniref:NACHT domain-containing protein n=1 Tax=Alligator mississippiensis TaxID=8496 RepID=A0A151N533_ALLMI|nr:hypothetical protein Y1Q_0018841 [Alligator mississippiensis]
MHSFYHGKDHPEHQAERLRGRTQLFPQEFPNGNASLLLRRLSIQDAGNYTCHAVVYDAAPSTEHNLQLHVLEEEVPIKQGNNRLLFLFAFMAILLLVLLVVVTFLIKKKCKKSDSCSAEDAEKLIEDRNAEVLERFRRAVCERSAPCYKLFSEKESDNTLDRKLYMISGKKLRAASEITNYIYRSQEKVASIQPEELFTTKKPNATRMLLVGNTAKIISRTCKRLQQKWASEENKVVYGCVTYIPCRELKSSERPMSVRELLEQQCKELAPVLPDLLSTGTVLVILDGLEEFKDDLSDTQSSGSLDIDTPLVISALVWKVITKDLLPETDVLVTAQLTTLSSRTLEAGGTDTTPPAPVLNVDSKFLEDIKEITFRLAKMCYDCLVSDAQEIQREELESPADIGAMKYSLEKSTLQVLDLRLCDLQDENLEQLDSVMKSCTQVWISYNKLTEKSGRILQRVLEYPNCRVQYLSNLDASHFN